MLWSGIIHVEVIIEETLSKKILDILICSSLAYGQRKTEKYVAI